MSGRFWTTEEVDFLKKNYLQYSLKELSEQTSRTIRSIQHKILSLKLPYPEPSIGDKFNRLKILDKYSINKYGQSITMARCLCDCGNQYIGKLTCVVGGSVKSCGCLKREMVSKRITIMNTTHGGSGSKLYKIWAAAKTRCKNPNVKYYKDYGGRGIEFCDEWTNSFENFKEWSLSHGYIEGLSLDRKDVNGNYCPSNCQWVTMYEQAMNRRNSVKVNITAFGETKSVHQWAEDKRCTVGVSTICYRIGTGWTPEDAISKPSERRHR